MRSLDQTPLRMVTFPRAKNRLQTENARLQDENDTLKAENATLRRRLASAEDSKSEALNTLQNQQCTHASMELTTRRGARRSAREGMVILFRKSR